MRAALAAFAKLYADRHGRDGIRMNNLLPGVIGNQSDYSSTIPGLFDTIPLRRPGTVEEIAKTAAFLLSPDSGYISGQNILADGAVNRSF
jgi:NAD(P)-dependent dehydrogenase (short-subunit alcohol dehydrogenase family)